MAVVHHFALNLVRQAEDKRPNKRRRKRAAWDLEYLLRISRSRVNLDSLPCVGWDAVKKASETNTFNVWSELKVTQLDGPYIQVKADVAWSTGISKAEGKLKTGTLVTAPTFETDVFEKSSRRWLLYPTPHRECSAGLSNRIPARLNRADSD